MKQISLIAGHTTIDLYPGMLGPLLPILVEKNSWSLPQSDNWFETAWAAFRNKDIYV